MDGTRGFSRPVTPAHLVQRRAGLAPASGVTTKKAWGVPGEYQHVTTPIGVQPARRRTLEGSRSFAASDGGALTPSLEVGLRHDGRDAEIGTGIEIGGGLSYTDPASGLTVDAKARGLVAHEDAEWGAGGVAPSGCGRSMTRRISCRTTRSTRGSASMRRLAAGSPSSGTRASLPHLRAGRGRRTPKPLRLGHLLRPGFSEWNLESEFGENARVLRAGYGYRLGNVLDLNLEATRRDPVNDEAPEHGLMLRGEMRW